MLTRARELAAPVGITIVLFLAVDFLVSTFYIIGSPIDLYINDRQDQVNRAYRIKHDVFHHALLPNYDGDSQRGATTYRVRTNDLGFPDAAPRTVAKKPDGRRIVLMGDSFVEGIGLPWDKTIPGVLSRLMPQVEVLNGGVGSYFPSIYYARTKWLIESGYAFDHIVVLIDLSDIRDEAWYTVRDGRVVFIPPGPGHTVGDAPPLFSWQHIKGFIRTHFQLTMFARRLVSGNVQGVREAPYNLCVSAWTYDNLNPATDKHFETAEPGRPIEGFASCPRADVAELAGDSPHIDKAIEKARHWMTKLHELVAQNGIKLSVGVYPWPAQLHHDDRNSLQVRIWEAWCKTRCETFINTFPAFWKKKDQPGYDWYAKLFIRGDVHFNERGNALVAEQLHKALMTVTRK